MAQAKCLGAISITDHDTLAGSKQAQQIGQSSSVRYLTGIEVSAAPPPSTPFSGSFHILGYGINPDDSELNQTLLILQQARKNRNPGILKHLNRLGFDITLAEVVCAAGDGQIGRPHIARMMVKKGFVQSVDEAFDCYLGHGKPAYVDKYRISCQQAIDIIRGAGGIPVLAHPFLLNIRDNNDLEKLFVLLKNFGLKGIEVYYPEHPPAETNYYAHLAQKHELLMTGGTDFHGNLKPEIEIGTGSGNFCVPYRLYEQLMACFV